MNIGSIGKGGSLNKISCCRIGCWTATPEPGDYNGEKGPRYASRLSTRESLAIRQPGDWVTTRSQARPNGCADLVWSDVRVERIQQIYFIIVVALEHTVFGHVPGLDRPRALSSKIIPAYARPGERISAGPAGAER